MADEPTQRCEPPPELRGVDGWHWLDADRPIIGQYKPGLDRDMWMIRSYMYETDSAYRQGYRYLAPVTPPAEVERLRAEVERLRGALRPFVRHYEEWMDKYDDADQMSVFPRHTFGEFRAARAALAASGEGRG